MHHHLFPSEDTYITNLVDCEDKNFALSSLLRVGTTAKEVLSLETTRQYTYSNVYFGVGTVDDPPANADISTGQCVTSFNGTLTGSFSGSSETAYGIVVASASFSSSYFSGSIDGGLISELSGSVSGSISGSITGSLFAYFFPNFNGEFTSSTGRMAGIVSGTDTVNEHYWKRTSTKFVDRSLIKFDLDTISASIAAGEITNPEFKLNLKICNEYQLPIEYSIYAFPVSQSWIMGNGDYIEGGSNTGVSWWYTDYSNGTEWHPPITSSIRPVLDFLTTSSNATASFAYGGGTWYYDSSSVQNFSYESSDISMDVTDIVMAWVSGSLPNNGFILMSSDEIAASGSGYSLSFYSKDTNTISYPYLDIMWDDYFCDSGSVGTSSVVISEAFSGAEVTIQTGSTFSITGGANGTFSGDIVLTQLAYYITASNVSLTESLQQFTGSISGSFITTLAEANGLVSGSGIFTSSYFSGSIDGGAISESIDFGASGSKVIGLLSGSTLTSASISYFEGGVTSSMIDLMAYVMSGHYLDTVNFYVSGIIVGTGNSGNVSGLPIVGPFSGFLSTTSSTVTGSCGSSFTGQWISGSFTDGALNGLSIGGFFVDNKLQDIQISGSWPPTSLYGASVEIPIPSGVDPYAYAYVSGPYISGKAFGTYQTTRSIADTSSLSWDSASFQGQFIEGAFIGGNLYLQLSGSITTSSYAYTSSIEYSSSAIQPLNTEAPFTVIIKNLKPEVSGGDLVKIRVFGREQFPLKTFEQTSQQSGYFIPQLLPTSSYYAIKDNMSEETIVDFDDYTKISCEHPEGNYFILDTTGLAQERPYRILIRVDDGQSVYTFDNGDVFKITR